MTLIIAAVEPDRILMAADSAFGNPEEFYVYPDIPKIARCGPYLVGSCGITRIGQALHHLVEWPEPPESDDLLPFLIREVLPEIRRAVEGAGAAQPGRAFLGDKTVILIGVRRQLFAVGADLAVVRPSGGLACIGRGRHVAYPVMKALKAAGIEPARKRMEMTLEIVAQHVPVVRPPFRLLELTAESLVEVPTPRAEHLPASRWADPARD